MREAPKLLSIEPDGHRARDVGRTADGLQFFLTNPFLPATGGSEGREFLALYLFDPAGQLHEARIEDLGTRAEIGPTKYRRLFAERLADIGPVTRCRIEVTPFRVERFGTVFGLIAHPPEADDAVWQVTAEPGDYMEFRAPWDSGKYDT